MAKSLDPSTSSILVIGCGTWGSSTALHLARRGYKHVTVLDPYPVPSPISAGNDINKIARGRSRRKGSFSGENLDDEDWTNEEVRIEATQAWLKDPIFKDFFHETGYIMAASQPENVKDLIARERPTPERGFVELPDADAFRKTMPKGVLTGEFPNWRGYYKASGAGWVHARKALVSCATEAQRLGAKLVSGDPQGKVTSLIFGQNGEVTGARTADGKEHVADATILAAGANAPQLLDMKDQLRPTAWTLAHIKMTPEETKLYKDLPVLFNVERGFFMEPDEDNHELKICDEHPGYCNWSADMTSLPFARHQIPKVSEAGVRDFLRETMPHLAERPFVHARICWCADTPNRAFLISPHPEHANLTLAVGGSGQGFMQIPVIGKYIVDCMEDKLDPRMKNTWRWRPETAVNRDWNALQGRLGGAYALRNFKDVGDDEWTTIAS